MDDYIAATNAADGSKMDANANVTHKNIATMENELMKDFLVQVEPCASEPQNQRAFRRRMGAGIHPPD